jgi:hypothetical protein
MTFAYRHISIGIDRSPQDVYLFASDAGNLPAWASGIGDTIEFVDGDWVVDSPGGRLKVEFASPNPLGVLDHVVTMNTGETFYNPMRVIQSGEGSEVVFSLYRVPGVDEQEYETDAATIAADLATLKRLLEARPEA